MSTETRQDKRLFVLVVDDEPPIRDLFLRTIRYTFGVQALTCHAVSSGREALDALQSGLCRCEPYAVAFVDLTLGSSPEGIGLVTEMRRLDPYLHLVIVSGAIDQDVGRLLSQVPPPDRLLFLDKPFQVRDILQAISVLGGKWALERQVRELESLLAAGCHRLSEHP